jgi:radical SAM protein with 4Fe4S-binding SPASM domain
MHIHNLPKILRIEPASSCNFHCIHCPTGLDLNPSLGIMNEDSFEKIYEKISKYSFKVIVLYHGGEPFLNRNFSKMVKKLRPLADTIKTVTNGSLLNESIIDQILDSGIDIVEFSLDGQSPEENDKVRVGGNFFKISENIKKLVIARNNRNLSKPEIYISNIQFPKDVHQLDKIEVPQYLKNTFKEIGDDIQYKLAYAMSWPGLTINPQPSKIEHNYCDHIINTFTIRWNGDVVPCCFDLVNMMVMGNVLNEEIEDIWNNKQYQKLRDDIKNFNPPDLCKNCIVLSSKKRIVAQDFML